MAIARLDQHTNEVDKFAAWILSGICTLTVLMSIMYAQDTFSLVRGIGSAAALGSLPLVARHLYREGIDSLDAAVSALTGFVLGASSWSLAWKVMLGSVALSGLVALLNLAKKEQTTRVPFAFVVAGFASVAAIRSALW